MLKFIERELLDSYYKKETFEVIKKKRGEYKSN